MAKLNLCAYPHTDVDMLKYIIPRDSDKDLAYKVFCEFKYLMDDTFNIILFKEYHPQLTDYYYRIASDSRINGANTANTLYELMDFTNRLIEYHSHESMVLELYGMYYKVFTKYMSFERPKSSISLFLIRNIMITFRDYIRVQSVAFRKMDNETTLEDLPVYDNHFSYENDIYTSGLFSGVEGINNRFTRYVLYLKMKYKASWTAICTETMSDMSVADITNFIKWSINEKGIYATSRETFELY